jgi:hypothetical protein
MIGNARANASASTYRAGPANVLSRAKPQKSHAALQTFVTETSQTAGNTRSGIFTIALWQRPDAVLSSFPRKRESSCFEGFWIPALGFAAAGMTIFARWSHSSAA